MMGHRSEGRVVATGYPSLDEELELRRGGVYLLTGRPGTARTALCLNIALNVATNGASPAGVVYICPIPLISTRS